MISLEPPPETPSPKFPPRLGLPPAVPPDGPCPVVLGPPPPPHAARPPARMTPPARRPAPRRKLRRDIVGALMSSSGRYGCSTILPPPPCRRSGLPAAPVRRGPCRRRLGRPGHRRHPHPEGHRRSPSPSGSSARMSLAERRRWSDTRSGVLSSLRRRASKSSWWSEA